MIKAVIVAGVAVSTALSAQPANPSHAATPRSAPVRLAAIAFTDTVPLAAGRASNAEVRMLFCSVGGVWRSTQASPVCSAPMPTSWNAWHDGRIVGRVVVPLRSGAKATSMSPTPIRVRDVDAAMRIPVNGDRFERWSGSMVYRPLALVVSDSVRDPEQWQPIDLTRVVEATTVARVRQAFRRGVRVPRCESVPLSRTSNALVIDSIIRDRDLIVTAAFRSRSGAMLVGLMLDEQTHPCDDVRDPSRTEQWFAIDAASDTASDTPRNASNSTSVLAPRLLGNEMHPVGVADYDGDGHAEWLFSLSRYNEDGYVLVADNLRLRVTTSWHLH